MKDMNAEPKNCDAVSLLVKKIIELGLGCGKTNDCVDEWLDIVLAGGESQPYGAHHDCKT